MTSHAICGVGSGFAARARHGIDLFSTFSTVHNNAHALLKASLGPDFPAINVAFAATRASLRRHHRLRGVASRW